MSQIDYIELIHKQLSDRISQEELAALNAWMNADEENRYTAETIRAVWNLSDMTDSDLEDLAANINSEDEFSFLRQRINNIESDVATTPVIPLKRRSWKLVAGFALILGIASSWFLYNQFGNSGMVEIQTEAEPQEILLADGSTIHLNANSSVTYPKSFDGETREIRFRGEGFFEIARDTAHPFIIHTQYEDVTVLGTSFNIRALDNEPNSEIAVITGRVAVSSGVTTRELSINEKAIVDHSSGLMLIEETTKSPNETAWMTGSLTFSNTLLAEVLEDLEAYYNVRFSIQNPKLANCPFTANFQSEKLITVLNTISTVLDVSINEESKENYVLVGGGCQ